MTARPVRILAAAAGITAAAPAGLAAALINAAIIRKPPLSDEASDDSDLVAATTAAARREGCAWMAATPHQRWTVTAHDGTRLAGYYFPAPWPAQRTVILIHGHRAEASLMGNFARDYRARGFNVFMADNRAHGHSGGRYVGMGWLDHFDYLRWISRLVRTVGPDARIVLHGLSMGGATALLLSGSRDLPPQVRAVISDCSFSSAYAELAYHLRARHLPARPILPLASQMCSMLAGYRLTQASPFDAIARAAVPVLLIHGGAAWGSGSSTRRRTCPPAATALCARSTAAAVSAAQRVSGGPPWRLSWRQQPPSVLLSSRRMIDRRLRPARPDFPLRPRSTPE